MIAAPASRLHKALLDASRAFYRATFEREAGVREHSDADLQALATRFTRLLTLSMVAADFAGRAEASSLRRGAQRAGGQRIVPVFATMPFDEAIEYLAELRPAAGKSVEGVVPDVAATYRAMEFRLRPQLSLQVVETVQHQLAALMRDGATARDFVSWARQLGEGYVSDAYAETVWRTEVTRAQTAGRIRQVMDDPALQGWIVAWRYHAVGDADTRDNHAAMNGRMYAIRHEAWRKMTPPNGWRCRCRLVPVSKLEARRLGRWQETPAGGEFVSDEWPVAGAFPDPGFGASPVQEIYGG